MAAGKARVARAVARRAIDGIACWGHSESNSRSGRLALQVRPVKLANKAVMDLRTVRWVPVGVDDDSESNAR